MGCTILRLQLPIYSIILPFSPAKLHSFSSNSNFHTLKPSKTAQNLTFKSTLSDSKTSGAQVVEDEADVDVVEGLTMTQFCDKMIDLFINEKPRSKDWKKYLCFREEWKKYRDKFYSRCRTRADMETDPVLKRKLSSLGRKVKKIDDEIERYTDLLKEIEDNPTDINAIVAKRRRDFSGEFFLHLTYLQQTYDSLEDRDAVARLAARCLTAVSAYDNTLEIVDTFDTAQAKFDDILNSPSIDIACEKIKSFAKGKQLDSSLILLINSAWAKAKESTTMKNEVKEIMYRIYKTTKSSMRSITPKEITLLKHLLNITDPEERFSALATSFSPGSEHEAKDPNGLYTTPKELHKWIKIMLDAYHLSQEETEIREAKQINEPVVIQRLFILKETIEEEYLERQVNTGAEANKSEEEF
ncbi:uncharacterized protein At4g37920, chloroplastic-like [Chenopodium quinoa]|uniref:uncharacterized protein At4g37920, chloroplastic-like n=1 Tax=Chenopodium quinoa TaxID=63459 RepID=UPI000B77ADA6|nr:uncharacterized protein At4g37920, chloroplastic-like [Chenopodium quinoa]